MSRKRGMAGRVASGVLAAVFFVAGGPDAYGLRPCPHHVPVPTGEHAPADAPSPAGEHAPGHTPSPDDRHAHPESHAPTGPQHGAHGKHNGGSHDNHRCTCLQTCHGSAAVPTLTPPPAGPATAEAARPAVLVPHTDPDLRGPHHEPFELPLPNAPPGSI